MHTSGDGGVVVLEGIAWWVGIFALQGCDLKAMCLWNVVAEKMNSEPTSCAYVRGRPCSVNTSPFWDSAFVEILVVIVQKDVNSSGYLVAAFSACDLVALDSISLGPSITHWTKDSYTKH